MFHLCNFILKKVAFEALALYFIYAAANRISIITMAISSRNLVHVVFYIDEADQSIINAPLSNSTNALNDKRKFTLVNLLTLSRQKLLTNGLLKLCPLDKYMLHCVQYCCLTLLLLVSFFIPKQCTAGLAFYTQSFALLVWSFCASWLSRHAHTFTLSCRVANTVNINFRQRAISSMPDHTSSFASLCLSITLGEYFFLTSCTIPSKITLMLLCIILMIFECNVVAGLGSALTPTICPFSFFTAGNGEVFTLNKIKPLSSADEDIELFSILFINQSTFQITFIYAGAIELLNLTSDQFSFTKYVIFVVADLVFTLKVVDLTSITHGTTRIFILAVELALVMASSHGFFYENHWQIFLSLLLILTIIIGSGVRLLTILNCNASDIRLFTQFAAGASGVCQLTAYVFRLFTLAFVAAGGISHLTLTNGNSSVFMSLALFVDDRLGCLFIYMVDDKRK